MDDFTGACSLLGDEAARAYCGNMGRATKFARIKEGLFPPGIELSVYKRAWYRYELDLWNAAKARAATDAEVRALVQKIVAGRKVATPGRVPAWAADMAAIAA